MVSTRGQNNSIWGMERITLLMKSERSQSPKKYYVAAKQCGQGQQGPWRVSEEPAGFPHAQSLSRVRLFEPPRTIAPKLLCPRDFPRQEYWCGSPFPSPGDLPNPRKWSLPALAGGFSTTSTAWEAQILLYLIAKVKEMLSNQQKPGSYPSSTWQKYNSVIEVCL